MTSCRGTNCQWTSWRSAKKDIIKIIHLYLCGRLLAPLPAKRLWVRPSVILFARSCHSHSLLFKMFFDYCSSSYSRNNNATISTIPTSWVITLASSPTTTRLPTWHLMAFSITTFLPPVTSWLVCKNWRLVAQKWLDRHFTAFTSAVSLSLHRLNSQKAELFNVCSCIKCIEYRKGGLDLQQYSPNVWLTQIWPTKMYLVWSSKHF